ncbi:MAG: adenylate/guanylate cyclase domain-containing protein [Gammaproteobacteria bacterium]
MRKARLFKSAVLLAMFLALLAQASGIFNIGMGLPAASGELTTSLTSLPFMVYILTGLALSFLLPVLTPIQASLLTFIAVLPPAHSSYLNIAYSNELPIEYQLFTILVLFVLNVLIAYFDETRSKQAILNTFRHYVPPDVVNEICRNPDQITLDGEARELTIMFCDLKNFSGVAEELNPKQLTILLNEYFTAMSRILHKHGATIDKYIGDSIMAFWGAPLAQPDHASRAVHAAFDMQTESRRLIEDFKRRGWPAPEMCIGINTGLVNVGNMGSEFRISYTVIGDAVNIASRLQGLTRDYLVPIIVSQSTKVLVTDVAFRLLDEVRVRGKHNKTSIFEPVVLLTGIEPAVQSKLEMHKKAITALEKGEIETAKQLFKRLQSVYPKDLYYEFMLKRI